MFFRAISFLGAPNTTEDLRHVSNHSGQNLVENKNGQQEKESGIQPLVTLLTINP